ncbi:hypothetical protein MKSMC1_18730 [Mycobacterium kansasii]|nr:hypothetical protein MKSMC1_18730 [Mycobacterium kansasii]
MIECDFHKRSAPTTVSIAWTTALIRHSTVSNLLDISRGIVKPGRRTIRRYATVAAMNEPTHPAAAPPGFTMPAASSGCGGSTPKSFLP